MRASTSSSSGSICSTSRQCAMRMRAMRATELLMAKQGSRCHFGPQLVF